MTLPSSACLRLHHDALRLRFLTRGLSMLWCSTCEAFRS